MPDPLEVLEEWYLGNCDGDWEHSWGLSIGTLDNPGWSVRIDLTRTSLEGRTFRKVKVERGENDWMHCWVEMEVFNGCGGPKNLREILRFFTEWHTAETVGGRQHLDLDEENL